MKKMNVRRILAIAALMLIVCLYAVTTVCALIDSPFARSCLMASLFCTIVVPVVIYAFLMFTRQVRGRGDQLPGDGKDSENDEQG